MSTWLHDIRSLLIGAKLVGAENATTWPCTVGALPDDRASCVALFPYSGAANSRYVKQPRLQILVAGADYEETLARAEKIEEWAVKQAQVEINQTNIRWILPVGTANHLGRDTKDQHWKFSVNVEVTLARWAA